MKRKGIMLLFACLLLWSMTSCQAEERKEEWKHPSFNFRAVKSILIVTSVDPAKAQVDEFSARRVEGFYGNAFSLGNKRWAHNNFNFITQSQLIDRVGSANGENMRQLAKDDPARYQEEMDRLTPLIVDATLNIKVTAFYYDKRFVPEQITTYTEDVEMDEDIQVQDSNGHWIHQTRRIKKPVERTRIIPAHYDTYGNAGVAFTLVDMKTKETVWMLLDVREAYAKDPIDMTERIVNRAADNMSKI